MFFKLPFLTHISFHSFALILKVEPNGIFIKFFQSLSLNRIIHVFLSHKVILVGDKILASSGYIVLSRLYTFIDIVLIVTFQIFIYKFVVPSFKPLMYISLFQSVK
jgi:hypothetical protein